MFDISRPLILLIILTMKTEKVFYTLKIIINITCGHKSQHILLLTADCINTLKGLLSIAHRSSQHVKTALARLTYLNELLRFILPGIRP